ncbi:hypothetical protein I4U23_007465 [Adineta vaga]|nr:hypothetical protein I4U23_007465 [Adineta vaga]
MGNRTSRNNSSRRSQAHSFNTKADRQCLSQKHMDLHYHVMDRIVNQHFVLMNSNMELDQAAMNVHRQALNIAMRNHIQTAHINRTNLPQSHQIVYNITNKMY